MRNPIAWPAITLDEEPTDFRETKPRERKEERSHGIKREKPSRNIQERKTERKVLPKPIPIQPRFAHVLRIAVVLNQP